MCMRAASLGTVRRGKLRGLVGLVGSLLGFGFSFDAQAQVAALWDLAGEAHDAQLVLEEARLRELRPGDIFTVVLPDGDFVARLEELGRFPNGDLKLQAQFEDHAQHSLIMTLGSA